MTKKLFVVLVVIAAMLVTFSLVVGEKGVRLTNDTQIAEKPAPPGTATFQPLPPKVPTSADKGFAEVRPTPDRGDKATPSYSSSGDVIGVINESTGKDYCDLYGSAAWYITNYFYGLEWYANYQDPEEFGCVDVWPFEVVKVCFNINIPELMTFQVQGFVLENVGEPDCPFPGDILCETPVYDIVDIPAGHWQICLPLSEQCCVLEPYFAGIYLYTDFYPMADRPDPVSEDDPTDLCRSYNDWGYGWEDLVAGGWPGEMMLNTEGWTRPQNDCEIPDTTCLLQRDVGGYYYLNGNEVGDGYGIYFDPEVECGTPTYPFGIDEVMFYLSDNVPPVNPPCTWPLDVRVTIYDLGGYDPCMAQDVAEEVCSEVFTIQQAEAGAMISRTLSTTCCLYDPFIVALHLEAGTDFQPNLSQTFPDMAESCYAWAMWGDWLNWSEIASIFGVAVGYPVIRARGITQHADCAIEECHLQSDVGVAYNIAMDDAWANYFDPAVCGEPTYRFGIDTIAFALGTSYATYPQDVKVVVYGLIAGDSCNGPGEEIYSEIHTINITEWTFFEIALAEVACVDEPFFVGIEYAGGPGEGLNPMASATPPVVDDCRAWGRYMGTWYNWYEIWGPDTEFVSYPVIRAYGKIQHPDCPEIECEVLSYTHGGIVSYSVRPEPSGAMYGRDYLNERFTSPANCTIGKARLLFWPDGTVGAPDLEVILWEDNPGGGVNGGDVPGAQIASIYVPAPIPEYPDWAEVDFYPMGIGLTPGQEIHCGYTCPNFDPGTPTNQLGLLLDNGGYGSHRLSEYFGDFGWWEEWILIYTGEPDNDAFIELEVCYDTPDFKLFVTPSHRDVAGGDATDYTVTLEPILGFSDPVYLTVAGLPGTAGTASFTVDPVTPPGTSTLDITTYATAEAFGSYVLTVTATSGAIVYQKDVTLRILSPFNEEALVNFFHGTQRTSNFGALANGALSDNFLWYGKTAQLYDATLISAVPGDPQGDHMALDLYDCEYLGFIPDQPIEMLDEPWCAGDPEYEEAYGQIAYSHFYTTEDVISCEYDSLFVVGLRDVECTDFSIKIKIYYNPTEIDIPELYVGVYEDWDVGTGASSPWQNGGDMDTLHNLMWQYDLAEENIVFGLLKIPFYDEYMHNMTFISNYNEVYPGSPHALFDDCGDLSPLYDLMTTQMYRYPGFYGEDCVASECDYSQLMVAPPFSLNPDEKHIEIWIDFGRDLNADGMTWEQWYHRVLRYAGFYRGDVDASDTLDLPCIDISDLVYLINYLYKGGPAPLPFADQGNVDGQSACGGPLDTDCPKNNVGLQDVLYLINYTYKGGPAPIDYVRFIPQYWSRSSMFLSPFNTWP